MKLFYIANARIPTEKAYGVNVVKMCQALALVGNDVTLIIPRRKNLIEQDIFSYYGAEKNFSIEYIPTIDLVAKGFFGYWISQSAFSLRLLLKKFDKETVIITRDEWSGWLLAKLGYHVYYDMHGFPITWQRLWRWSMRSMRGIFCTNQWKIEQCHQKFGIAYEKMVLARNGFDERAFTTGLSKKEAREKVGLPDDDKKIVMYTGHLYDWKGADVLARAASFLKDICVVFVGGMKQDVENFVERNGTIRNLLVLGQKPHIQMPLYLMAADVLVIPNSKISDNLRAIPYSIYDTSPIKLFEYMSSRRPIVASDLPSIREIVDEKTAVFFKPDDPEDLAKKINYILNNKKEAEDRANLAWQSVQKYTWKRRAQIMLDYIEFH